MSRKALEPIFYAIANSTRIHLGRPLNEMDKNELERLENYLLREFHALYTPVGRVPTVYNEKSPECKDLENRIKESVEKDKKSMEEKIDRLIRRYNDLQNRMREAENSRGELEFPSLFPPPPWVVKKKERRREEQVIEVAA
jgi:chromosome segregation ATPase